jgi:hypothetical protein
MRPNRLISSVAFAVAGAWWFCASPALASACMEEIARLEQRLRNAKTNPADQPTASQSIGAQLGHQPTPESVAEAELRADEAVQAILNRARAFDAENKAGECEKAVARAKLHFGP